MMRSIARWRHRSHLSAGRCSAISSTTRPTEAFFSPRAPAAASPSLSSFHVRPPEANDGEGYPERFRPTANGSWMVQDPARCTRVRHRKGDRRHRDRTSQTEGPRPLLRPVSPGSISPSDVQRDPILHRPARLQVHFTAFHWPHAQPRKKRTRTLRSNEQRCGDRKVLRSEQSLGKRHSVGVE